MKASPPPDLLRHISGSASLEGFIATFPHIRLEVRRHLGAAGFDFAGFDSILDLGCGVGRFLFAFESELTPRQRLWGCDVHEGCARWCRENIDFAEVAHNPLEPPLPYQGGQFDLVYALSVFTHLRLDLQLRWAAEVYRVLRPGGVLFASLHGPQFFSVFQAEQKAASGRVFDVETMGDEGLFAYLASPRGNAEEQGQVDVAAAHSPALAAEQFSAFRLVKRFPQTVVAAGQDIYIFQKGLKAAPLALPNGHGNGPLVEQPGKDQQPASFVFTLRGNDCFKVYPRVEPAGFYPVEFEIEIANRDGLLVKTERPFNTNRVFGGNHHGVLEVATPRLSGEVTVRLRTVLPNPRDVPKTPPVAVTWLFPHFR